MFTTYSYAPKSTRQNVLNDVVSLLTGVTDKTLLSANCVQANTTIISDASRPAGWSVWDSAAGTNMVAIRAPNVDGETYKYVVLDCSSTTYVYLRLYEYWNPTTHTGMNMANSSNSYGWTANLTTGGTFIVSASAKSIFGFSVISGSYKDPVGIFERTRVEPYDTPARGLPPVVWGCSVLAGGYTSTSADSAFSSPRIVDTRTKDDLLNATLLPSSAYTTFSGGSQNLAGLGPEGTSVDAGGNEVYLLLPINVSSMNRNFRGGTLYEVWVAASTIGVTGDEVVYEGKPYYIMAGSYGSRIAVPKF